MSSLPPPGVMRLTVRRRVIVHGRVQGVGFRFAVARAAEARAVTGWVRNRADGAVEAVFEGEPERVESLIRFCGSGPRAAAVARIETVEEEPEGLARLRRRLDAPHSHGTFMRARPICE